MGIPSFYRHLLRRYPQLIARGVGARPEWLCLDFNCAMYYVLRTMPPVASATSQVAWEADFCKAIADYMGQLITLADPTKGVYVSCDGAVCAAKRRQQRLRRFKGPWMAATEAAVKRTAGGEAEGDERKGWDQNALTPGTAFMERLGNTLTATGTQLASRTGLTITVSTTAEAGEGEHKLLRQMRAVRPTSCMIYGLDADLILLAALLGVDTGADVRLLREAQEFERVREGADGQPEWRTLTIRGLMNVLIPGGTPAHVRDFVASMSLLGNDFLPRSLTRTVRDDGIPQLLEGLRALWRAGQNVVDPASGRIRREGLLILLSPWAATEEADMMAVVREAVRASTRPAGIGASPVETALKEWQAQPARWCSISRLLAAGKGWRDIYRKTWHAGSAGAYLEGVAWTWDYYSGRTVDQGWLFDPHLPPLWGDVVAALRSSTNEFVGAPPVRWPEPLPDWLHLLSVLPAASVENLLPPARRVAMTQAPWYWPSSWSLFDIGRGQMWECEPVIPVIPEEIVRSWISSLTS